MWSKPADFTLNAPVKIAVKSERWVVIDDDNKENDMTIIGRC
jgi:hypothetical protein